MRLDRNAIGIVEAAFMGADFDAWTVVARSMNRMPAEQRAAMKDRMVKHALREQARTMGRDALLRQLTDLGTRRGDGGNFYARIGKDQTETAIESLAAFVRTLPE